MQSLDERPGEPGTGVSARPRKAWRAGFPAAARLVSVLAAVALDLAGSSPAPAGVGTIDDPTGGAALQVSFRRTPSFQDLAEAQAALTRMAALVCDATEGQVRFERIRLTSSPAEQDAAGLWFHDEMAASGGAFEADASGLGRLGSHMDVYPSAALDPAALAHLVAHHAFGLGDQYDEQRRRGGSCGIGPGFDADRLDERNHSLMQAAGGLRCSEGALAGERCARDDECQGYPCVAVLASEFSVASNHDLLRGEGGVCPRPEAVSRLSISGILPRSSEPLSTLDTSDYLLARATSAWHGEVEVLDATGALPGIVLHLYLAHTAPLDWQLSVAVDGGDLGRTRGELVVLRRWSLRFNEDFSLASVEPSRMIFELPGSSSKPATEVAIDLGTENPDPAGEPGLGYDGLQMTASGAVSVELAVDGIASCDAPWCASSWNETTARWEVSEQTLLHDGRSDWETLAERYPFLSPPTDLPAADPPAACETPPEFVAEIMGADQVVLVLDTSRSMGMRVDDQAGEVCANGIDDDDDGFADESDCAESRLAFERVAARAFLELARHRKVEVGLVAMHTDAEVLSGIESLSPERVSALGALLGSLRAEGDTAIGTALARSGEAFDQVARGGRSRWALLLTDGTRNVGSEPGQEARDLDPFRMRVFGVGIDSGADLFTLSALAARSGGETYAAEDASALTGVLAEIAARNGGHALLMPRTTFALRRDGGKTAAPAAAEFALEVEEQADAIVVVLAARNPRLASWRLLFELRGPRGERYDDASAHATVEDGFAVLRVTDPGPGRWSLRVLADASGPQRSDVVVWTEQAKAELVADVAPTLVPASSSARIGARLAYGGDLDGDVRIDGTVLRPDGSSEPVAFVRDRLTQAWSADFDRYAGRGLYQVRVRATVGENALPALGERIFHGPSRAPVRVVPFGRSTTTSFYLAAATPACQGSDCDGDGIANAVEDRCATDVDGDGLDNRYDVDTDNDELFDFIEGTADVDRDGIPDFCDPESTPTSMASVIEAQTKASDRACEADGAEGVEELRASLTAVRRIVQVVRTRSGVPDDTRRRIVEDLERVIALKKQALVIGDVLPEFCSKYRQRLADALALERALQSDIDTILLP